MTATERLRELLDERGVEWETDRSGFRVMWGRPVDEFHDTMEFKAVDNALPNGGLNVHICGATPEQAIAATLGAGACYDKGYVYFSERYFVCSSCGCEFDYSDFACEFAEGRSLGSPHFCPNCGRRVEVGE